jgi:membrane protein
MGLLWRVLKAAVSGFIANDALSRGASIAFYAATSLAPVLLIVVAIAGLAFGQDAARGAISEELGRLLGPTGADFIKSILARSSDPTSGATATARRRRHGAGNGIRRVRRDAHGIERNVQGQADGRANLLLDPEPGGQSRPRRRTGLHADRLAGRERRAVSPGTVVCRQGRAQRANTVVSLGIFTLLFAAIYRVLPDTTIYWRHLLLGAFVTALLFTVGKSLIGWYLGQAAPNSTYGAAGALIVLMFWVYYSAQIFLFGAELTKAIDDARNPAAREKR